MKSMKFFATALSASMLALSLVGCGGSSSSSSSNSKEKTVEQETKTIDESESAEQEEQKDQEEQPEIAVSIDSASIGQDYDGNPVVIVTYTFTNVSSNDAESYMACCSDDVYQNGVECETAFVTGLEGDSMAKVKKGASTTFQQAYSITDRSDVEVEVKELWSFDDTLIASAKFQFE